MKSRSLLLHTVLLTSTLFACNDELVVEEADSNVSAIETIDGRTDQVATAFTPLADEVDALGPKPVRKLFKSASAYRNYFGHDAPGVRWSSEWVVYYSAGMQSTDGHTAAILSIDYSPGQRRLDLVTAFESPGAGCETHALPELPYVLVKLSAPSPRPTSVRFYRQDSLRDCTTESLPEPVAADCSARTGGAFVTIGNVDTASESFTAWVTRPAFIDEAKRLLAAGEKRVPTFKLVDHTDCDGAWGWHIDAVDVDWADFTTEVCDAIPSMIQDHKGEWLASGQRWCPWGARVLEVDDRR